MRDARWLFTYEGFEPAKEGPREALCTLGNGYFATRGAAPEAEEETLLLEVEPDEHHTGYPDRAEPGLDNNAYTNLMAVWVLCRGLEVLTLLSAERREFPLARPEITADTELHSAGP